MELTGPSLTTPEFRVLLNIYKRVLTLTTSGRDGFMGRKGQSSFFSMSSNTIFGITLIMALLAPTAIRPGPYDLEIFTVVWSASYMYGYHLWEFGLTLTGDWTTGILIALLRCLFAYQVKRYCEYKARLVPTLILGLIVECFVLEVYLFFAFFMIYVSLSYPTPLMVVVAWLLMRRRPLRHDEQSWVGEERPGTHRLKAIVAEDDDD